MKPKRISTAMIVAVLLFVTAAVLFVRWLWFSPDEQIWPPPPTPPTRAAAAATADGELPALISGVLFERVRRFGSGAWRDLPEPQRTAWLVTRAESALIEVGCIRFALAARQMPTSPTIDDLALAYEAIGAPTQANLMHTTSTALTQPPAQAAMDAWLHLERGQPPDPMAENDAAVRAGASAAEYLAQRVVWLRANLDKLL